jgi:hypothetical protein
MGFRGARKYLEDDSYEIISKEKANPLKIPQIITNQIFDLKDKVNIYESFFNKLHMYRAIILNADKVKEGLDIISLFGTQGPNYETCEQYTIRKNKARERMRNF